MLREVSADVPNRIPPGVWAEASPDTAFSWDRINVLTTQRETRRHTVDCNPKEVANLLDLAARETEGAQIPQDEVVVSPASLELVPIVDERRAEGLGVCDHLACILLELWLRNLQERCGDGSDCLRDVKKSGLRLQEKRR